MTSQLINLVNQQVPKKSISTTTIYVTLAIVFIVCLLVLVLDTLWPHWVLVFLIPVFMIYQYSEEIYSGLTGKQY